VVRIPKPFRAGDQGKPGDRNNRLVSSIDFAPTVMNLAGLKTPEYMQGQPFLGANLPRPRKCVFGARDRMDERYDIIRSVRDKRYRYIRNYEPLKTYYQYMNTPEKGATMKEIRRVHAEGKLPPAAKLFMAERKPVEELYDLRNDPHEINNLAQNPKHQSVLKRMRAVGPTDKRPRLDAGAGACRARKAIRQPVRDLAPARRGCSKQPSRRDSCERFGRQTGATRTHCRYG
ncbi:MAG: sulfatase/phosphatase domain-containing protein, partial [Planctomycetota bacterium]